MDTRVLDPCSNYQPPTDFERCNSLSFLVLEDEVYPELSSEEELRASVETAIATGAPVDLRIEKLQFLGEFYRKKQKFEQYEATLLEIIHLSTPQQRSDSVLSALSLLSHLYRKHAPQYRTQVLSTLNTLISDLGLPQRLRWRLREMEIRLFCCWGEFQSADALHLGLISETKEKDIIEWKNLTYKLANVYRRAKRLTETENLYWAAFLELRAVQVDMKFVYRALHNFTSCYLSPPDCYSRTTNETRNSRLLETSIYLQPHLSPFYRSMLCQYLNSFNSVISNNEVLDIESFLCSVFHLLPDYNEKSRYQTFRSLVNLFRKRTQMHKETSIRLILLALSCTDTRPSKNVSTDLKEISVLKEGLNDFQGADIFLSHSVYSRDNKENVSIWGWLRYDEKNAIRKTYGR